MDAANKKDPGVSRRVPLPNFAVVQPFTSRTRPESKRAPRGQLSRFGPYRIELAPDQCPVLPVVETFLVESGKPSGALTGEPEPVEINKYSDRPSLRGRHLVPERY
jgi:hypothetical protein